MRVRNISGQDLEVPLLGRVVEEDAVVDVPDHLADYFLAGVKMWEAAEPSPPKKTPPGNRTDSKE